MHGRGRVQHGDGPAGKSGRGRGAVDRRRNAHTTVRVAESQPTRAHGTLTAGKRYAGNRPRVGYFRPVHRYSLMLGIGY